MTKFTQEDVRWLTQIQTEYIRECQPLIRFLGECRARTTISYLLKENKLIPVPHPDYVEIEKNVHAILQTLYTHFENKVKERFPDFTMERPT
jgi:hypothetical protein